MPRKMHLFISFPFFSYTFAQKESNRTQCIIWTWWYRPFNDITIHHQQPSRGHGWNPAGPLETLPTKCPCPIMSMGHTSFFCWLKEESAVPTNLVLESTQTKRDTPHEFSLLVSEVDGSTSRSSRLLNSRNTAFFVFCFFCAVWLCSCTSCGWRSDD